MNEGRSHSYIVALGSNMRVPGIGAPRQVLEHAFEAMEQAGLRISAASGVFDSAPLGPSLRRFANAVAEIETELDPPSLLATLQGIERQFGRRRRGQRWRARPLDLDIALWSGGLWVSPDLVIPHPLLRQRSFVLRPAARIAPLWRDPVSGLTLRQLAARLTSD